MYVPFEELAEHSRIWVYQTDRTFSHEEAEIIAQSLGQFCTQWTAHGHPLQTSFTIEHNRFVILGVDESSAGASGCSIDGSVRNLKELGEQLDLNFFDRQVAFLSSREIVTYPVNRLANLFAQGEITPATFTFNNFVTTKAEWTAAWKTPAKKSWLTKYLPKNTLSA
jgi:hypothetical protein